MNISNDTIHIKPETKYNMTVLLKPHVFYGKKGKAVPLQAWSGPEDFGKLRFPDFLT
jgi:hypothetical protein